MAEGMSRGVKFVVLAFVMLGAVAVFGLANADLDCDDAYISFRYAQNVAAGEGIVYNEGDRIYGTTALLWVLLLALVATVASAPVEHVSTFLALGLTALNAALIVHLVSRAARCLVLGVIAAAALLAAPTFLVASTMGMETPLYALWILLSFGLFADRRLFAAGVTSGLAFCTRPDGLAVGGAIGVLLLLDGLRRNGSSVRRRFGRPILAWGIGMGVVLVPFVLFCWTYYGKFLPRTLWAKRSHQQYHPRWMTEHFVGGPGWPVLAALAVVAVVGLYVWRRRASAVREAEVPTDVQGADAEGADVRGTGLFAVACVWQILYFAAWTVVGIGYYPWYVGAMGPAGALVLVAAPSIVARLGHRRLAGVFALSAIGVVVMWGMTARRDCAQFARYAEDNEWPRRRVAEAIRRFADPTKETLAAADIGVLGYYSGGVTFVDWGWLVTPRERLERGEAPKPTLVALFGRANVAPGQRLLYMASTPSADLRDRFLIGNPETTWRYACAAPRVSIDRPLGRDAHLVGIEPVRMAMRQGRCVQFEVQWRFERPLREGQVIRYTLGREQDPEFLAIETRGLFRDRVPYHRVPPGETALDFVNMLVTKPVPPGRYHLSVEVVGPGGGSSFLTFIDAE